MSQIDVMDVIPAPPPPRSLPWPGLRRWLIRLWRRTPIRRARMALHYQIESPRVGQTIDGHVLRIKGWACSCRDRIQSIHVEHPLNPRQFEVTLPRFDVAREHPSAVGVPWVGFLGHVSTLGLPTETDLVLSAQTASGLRLPLETIRLRREPLVSPYRPRLRPVLLYSFSRCGSSWTMRLLRHHPQMVVAGDFPHEVRPGQYWARLAHLLSQPFAPQMDPGQQSKWHMFEPRGTDGPQAAAVDDWLSGGYVEDLVASMQARTDEYYLRAARSLGRTEPVCFAEKIVLPFSVRLMREIYPGARVVFLVRDFRDMFCSVRSFNERRGFLAFGRELVSSDEEYVRGMARGVAAFRSHLIEMQDEAVLLRYEDLIRRPQQTLTRLFDSLALDNRAEVIEAVLSDARAETAGSEEHRTTPTQDRSIGRWLAELSPALRGVFRESFAELLAAFGYEPDDPSWMGRKGPVAGQRSIRNDTHVAR